MSQTPTPFDDLNSSGQPVPLSKNTQSLPPRPGSLLGNLQSGRKLPFDDDDAPVATAPITQLPPIVNPSAPVAPISSPPVVNGTAKLKLVPLPTLIGLAMAFGALAVVLISTLMSHLIPTVPMRTLPSPTAPAPDNDVIMTAPDDAATPSETPQSAATTAPAISAVPDANTNNMATPAAEPSAPVPTIENTPVPAASPADISSSGPGSTYRASRYEIAPPAGWIKLHGGRRTMWKGPQDAQLLVESSGKTNASPREDWEKLDRAFQKSYGSRYRSLGIRDSTLAGQTAAIWEFELTGKDGSVTRKMDVAVHHNGRGYAVLGAAPRDHFDALRPQIEAAINSFQLKNKSPDPKPEPASRADETRPRAQPLPADTNNDSQIPARDENTGETGY